MSKVKLSVGICTGRVVIKYGGNVFLGSKFKSYYSRFTIKFVEGILMYVLLLAGF